MSEKERDFNVLVVDDDEDVGYLFERLLGGPQEVTVATDGYDALEKAKGKKFDLIFIDVRLPGMDGVETLKRLKEVAPDAVVIMMSGHEVSDEVREAFSAGAQDFLAKPFRDVSEIMTIEQVARYLSLHESVSHEPTCCLLNREIGCRAEVTQQNLLSYHEGCPRRLHAVIPAKVNVPFSQMEAKWCPKKRYLSQTMSQMSSRCACE